MATSYALPVNGSANHPHSHHVHGYTRSHHRKAVPDRLAFAPTSVNEVLQMNAESSPRDMFMRPHPSPNTQPQDLFNERPQAKHEHSSTYESTQKDIRYSSAPPSASMDHRYSASEQYIQPKQEHYRFPSLDTHNHEIAVSHYGGSQR